MIMTLCLCKFSGMESLAERSGTPEAVVQGTFFASRMA